MKVRIVIEMDDQAGSFNVNGPFQNLGICYMLLDLARDVCQDEARKLKVGVLAAHPDDVTKVAASKTG